ncbi:metal-dependent transcriptional regulator [Methanomassiliicoccus luminyensis]|uniref:metal-dependent transcriptional regulator n=1 Tax=Methanomassiliicoccus luminyensis TaxID=1080712 RepID=UPI000378599E|nr:metal-dependent transcriptional regulator [Methanomassiliicoccus luminyensis]
MAREQLEMYLETIFDLAGKDGFAKTTAIANKLSVSPASVTEYIRSLGDKEYVKYEPYVGAKLTPAGLEIVKRLKRRHRLLEVFLSDVLKINPDKVHSEACRIEHYLSDETADALCRWLEAPSRSPHGKFITPCDKPIGSCEECEGSNLIDIARNCGENPIIPITELEPDQEGEIAFIRGGEKVVQTLSDKGLSLDTRVKLIRKASQDGEVELSVAKNRLSISGDIADCIFVTPSDPVCARTCVPE